MTEADEMITAEGIHNKFLGKNEQPRSLIEIFKDHNQKVAVLEKDNANNRLINITDNNSFHYLQHEESINLIMEFKYLYKNRSAMEINLSQKILKPNVSYGKACVYKNFQEQPFLI